MRANDRTTFVGNWGYWIEKEIVLSKMVPLFAIKNGQSSPFIHREDSAPVSSMRQLNNGESTGDDLDPEASILSECAKTMCV